MGSWGTAIYSNDTASDVRDACNTLYAFLPVEEATAALFREFREVTESGLMDDDYASFWYALADWQWKHGVLTEEVRQKTLTLLRDYAGLSDWEGSGRASDVKKRKAVLDELRARLDSPMPPVHLPKGRLRKPKHKPGDIIVFRTCSQEADVYGGLWNVDFLQPPFLFKDAHIRESGDKLNPVFYAYEKYQAILCVGSEKVPHAPYLPDRFDEYSVYAYYDFISEEKPTAEILHSCGFLPQIYRSLKDFNKNITDYIGWTYTFLLLSDSFHADQTRTTIEKLHDDGESERFHRLFAQKRYLTETNTPFELYHAFSAWEEKKRMEGLGISVDTLLDPQAGNPEFLTPLEIDAAHREWVARLSDDS